jgi:hypothetical protein
MNYRDELPEDLRPAYDEGYALGQTKDGWLEDIHPLSGIQPIQDVLISYARMIGFIQALREMRK